MNTKKVDGSILCLSDTIKIQPVLDGRGTICELALVVGRTGRWLSDGPLDASAEALRKAGRTLQASGCLAPLTMDHQLNVHSDLRLPEQLCRDLRIVKVTNNLLSKTGAGRAHLPIYPTAKIICNLPLSDRLLEGADLFRQYHDLRVSLRMRLLPCSTGGVLTPFGAFRAVGVRASIPAGIHHLHKQQEHFFSLLGQASRKGLGMLACDIQNMEDFNWLRKQPNVLFQGDVLYPSLSLEYVQQWLTGAEVDWRKFQLGGNPPQKR